MKKLIQSLAVLFLSVGIVFAGSPTVWKIGSDYVENLKDKIYSSEICDESGANCIDISAGTTAIPAGLDTQVQFNDGGVFAGDSGLTYNKTTDTLTATNISATSLSATSASIVTIGTGLTEGYGLFADASGNIAGDAGYFWNNATKIFQLTNPPTIGGNVLNGSHVEISGIGTPTYDSVQDLINATQSAGVISGGVISDGGSGSINISAVKGIVKTTDSEIGANVSFDLAGATGQALTDNSTNYITVDYNSGTPQFVIGVTNTANGHTIFNLGKVYREGTSLDIIDSGLNIYDFSKRVQQHHIEEADLHFVSGAIVSEIGTRNISITAGIMYAGLNRIITDAIDTSGADTFEYYYYNGSAWIESDQTAISNTQYNDTSSGLVNLTKDYGIHWVYKGTSDTSYVIYGQDQYKLNEAQQAQPLSSLPPHVEAFGVLRAKIIIKKDEATFTEIGSVLDTQFSTSTPSNHNELGELQGGTADEYYHMTSAQSAGFAINPMTTQGDTVFGGASGLPTRLAKGTASQVYTMNAGATAPEWTTASGGGDFSDGGDTAGADRTLGNTDNYDLGFVTNNLTRLHINNNGKIGIGITELDASLSVIAAQATAAWINAFEVEFSTIVTGGLKNAIHGRVTGIASDAAVLYLQYGLNAPFTDAKTRDSIIVEIDRNLVGSSIADDFNAMRIRKRFRSTSGVNSSTGSVLNLENLKQAGAGTINDSTDNLRLIQDVDSTGSHINFNSQTNASAGANAGDMWRNADALNFRNSTGVIDLATISGLEKSADPTEPTEGQFIMWMSDGTGKGDDGDIMIASQAGGTTNYSIIFDHSAGTTW